MFHKRQKIFAEKEPDNKRFRHNVANLFLTNNVSAIRAGKLYADAKAAGAGGVDVWYLLHHLAKMQPEI